MVPGAGRPPDLRRSLGGRLAVIATGVYAVVLTCYHIWSGYQLAVQFRVPTP